MAKSSGITTTVNLDDSGGTARNISNDVDSVGLNTPRGVQDITGLDKSAIERLLLLADGQVTLTGTFNPAATTGQHTVMRTMSSTSVTRTFSYVVNSSPSATLSMEMVITDYALNRAQDGSLKFTCQLQLADGAVPTWS